MRRLLSGCVFILALAVTSGELAYAKSSSIQVKVSLFPVGSFDVRSDRVEGVLKKSGNRFSGSELKVPVETMVTGISLRDRHMRERLDYENHPNVLVTEISAENGRGTAVFTVGGVSHPIQFEIKELEAGLAEARFPLKLPDYKISGISYRGVGVEDDVEVIAVVPYEAE
jgi:hypothetical protein